MTSATTFARLALALLLVCLLPGVASAQDVQPVPALSDRVIDQAAALAPAQHDALVAKLASLESETGSQVVVLIVKTTSPEDIAAYAQRVGDTWKIGRRDVGDGALIVVATQDRRVRIEVAKTLEGAIPDLAARQIITQQMTPAFKQGDYAAGIDAAIDQMAARIKGEALPAPAANARPTMGTQPGFEWGELALFMFAIVPVVASVLGRIFGRKLGSLATGGGTGAMAWWLSGSIGLGVVAGIIALVFALMAGLANSLRGYGPRGPGIGRRGGPVIWGPGSGWSGGGGFGGGGGGGGGFSSGGGGDFGGGGASGNW